MKVICDPFVKSEYVNGNATDCPTCIDLFCGAGGLSLGFCQAGGIPVAAVDNNEPSIMTYQNMFPFCEEVHHGLIEEWVPRVQRNSVNVVIGGPPCQGFSLARGFRFVDDSRNHLYKDFVRLVAHFRPEWLVMENVPGITNIGGGVILEQIMEDFDEIGYWVECRVINMADYGVPQTRKRAIFVGSRITERFIWPSPTHAPRQKPKNTLYDAAEPYVSVGDALSDLPWPMGKYFAHRANSKMRGPRNRNLWKDPAFTLRVRGDEFGIRNTPAKGVFAPTPASECSLTYRKASNRFQISMRERVPSWIRDYSPPKVVDTPPEKLMRPRRLSTREQARLQTFPDWFEFSGTPYKQGMQIGNAVPPQFAKMLFLEIFRPSSNGERLQY